MANLEKLATLIPLHELEHSAQQQIYDALKLDFLVKMAIMPDCLSEDTEVLTEYGFVPITKLTKDALIANVDIDNGKIFFDSPKDIIIRQKREDEKMFSFDFSSFNKSILMTENHRQIFKGKTILAKEIPNIFKNSDFSWNIGNYEPQNVIELSDDEVRLIAWIVGDGNIKSTKNHKSINYRVRFGLKKTRKIERVIHILESLSLKYSVLTSEKQTEIYISTKSSKKYINEVGLNKTYPISFITCMTKQQARVFLDELIMVDGDYENFIKRNTYRLNSSRKSDLDLISAIIALHFGSSNMKSRETMGFGKLRTHIYMSKLETEMLTEKSLCGLSNREVIKSEVEYDGHVVCLSTTSGYFIARQDGMTFVTGNCHTGYSLPIGGVALLDRVISPAYVGYDIGCGMCCIVTRIVARKLTARQREKIYKKILDQIPVGFNVRSNSLEYKEFKSAVGKRDLDNQVRDRLQIQLGTLGTGNHFIELGENREGFVVITIHSGSRNPGYTVGSHYMFLANNEDKTVPNGFLSMNHELGQAYLQDLLFCQQYALDNRKTMMEMIVKILGESWKELGHKMINENHN
ncbi:MAG: RtcB family protein, partial [Candidatus Peribacteraceae bacterium]|nr:RtcB family protein [Candidatus Peribacteraceae bacterium]